MRKKPPMVSARELVGKRIVAFDPGRELAGSAGMRRPMHQPRITLDDGSVLVFQAEEHPDGDYYGVWIGRAARP